MFGGIANRLHKVLILVPAKLRLAMSFGMYIAKPSPTPANGVRFISLDPATYPTQALSNIWAILAGLHSFT